MVAYSFHKRFADDVAEGRKTRTIRGHRKRHARIGEPVQLYAGMRTKQCRKLRDADPTCLDVRPIEIYVDPGAVTARVKLPPHPDWNFVSDDFARADGFANAIDFTAYWRETHGDGFFEGVLIKWAV